MALENLDFKTDTKLKTCISLAENLRNSQKGMKNVIDMTEKLSIATRNYSKVLKDWASALNELAMYHRGDMGDLLSNVSGQHFSISDLFFELGNSLRKSKSQLCKSGNLFSELDDLLKEIKSGSKTLEDQLGRCECKMKKTKKKGEDALKDAAKDYNEKREEIDEFKRKKLREFYLLERKEFGKIISSCKDIMEVEMSIINFLGNMEKFKEISENLERDIQVLSEEQEEVLVRKKTLYKLENNEEKSGATLVKTTNKILEVAMC